MIRRAIVRPPQLGGHAMLLLLTGIVEIIHEFRQIDALGEGAEVLLLEAEAAADIGHAQIGVAGQKVQHDLGRALAAADHRHMAQPFGDPGLGMGQVIVQVDHPRTQLALEERRDMGAAPGADADIAREPDLTARGHRQQLLAIHRHAADLIDRAVIAQRMVKLRRHPFHIAQIFAARRIGRLQVQKLQQPALCLEVGEKAIGALRVARGDEVAQRVVLDVSPRQRHVGMPGGAAARLQKQGAIQTALLFQGDGQRDVRGAEAHADHIIDRLAGGKEIAIHLTVPPPSQQPPGSAPARWRR